MRSTPFYFEIKDLLTQFVSAFDNIVIKRFNADRTVADQISVRYVYSPKQRVLYDIIDINKVLTLPAVAVSIGSVSRDNNRVFNKIDGFYYNNQSTATYLKSPIPVDIKVNMSIITRFQQDMDQILSNFIPYNNPYVVISWKVPTGLKLPDMQEIRSPVIWDGNITIEYPTDLNGQQKSRITADTTFTIKGWLFKDNNISEGANIFYVDTNYYAENIITDFETLSANTYTFPTSTNLINEKESFELSASPTITNMFFNGAMVDNNLSITPSSSGSNIMLYGENFNNVIGVLLSSSNPRMYTSPVITVSGFSRNQPNVTGQLITNFNIVSDSVLTFTLPYLLSNFRYPNSKFIFIPYNNVGYSTTTTTFSSANTFLYYGNI